MDALEELSSSPMYPLLLYSSLRAKGQRLFEFTTWGFLDIGQRYVRPLTVWTGPC